MAQTSINFRMDEELKQSMEKISTCAIAFKAYSL